MLKALYKKNYLPYITLICVTIISTFILWLPFLLKAHSINGIKTTNTNFETVIKHWDGPLYIIAAKTLYDKNDPLLKMSPLGLSPNYFTAHLPGFPLTLRAIALFLGYPKALLAATLLFSIALICFFYFFVSKLRLAREPFLLSLVLLFFTPRFLVVRSVGSAEPMFLLFIMASLYFFIEKKYFWAGLFGGLATITKTPGILLFMSYLFLIITEYLKSKRIDKQWLWLLLIPAGLAGVFFLYARQLGDFWAYFKSGDNIHLVFPPFSVFNYQKTWVATGWLEEIVFIYLFYFVAVLRLSPFERRKPENMTPHVIKPFLTFMGVFYLAIISVQHRDIARYSLPLLPLTLITFEDFFTSKKFLIALMILLPAIYFYAWNFMLTNTAPIADWGPFL